MSTPTGRGDAADLAARGDPPTASEGTLAGAATAERPTPAIRCGVLCDGVVLPAWQAECLKRLSETEGVELSLLVVDGDGAGHDTGGDQDDVPATVTHASGRGGRGVIASLRDVARGRIGLWDVYWSRSRAACDALRPLTVARRPLPESPTPLRSRMLPEGGAETEANSDDGLVVGAEAVHLVAGARPDSTDPWIAGLDILLDLSSHDVDGASLFPDLGVWSFRIGRAAEASGDAPPAFRELRDGETVVECSLVRTGGGPRDDEEALQRGWFRVVRDSYAQTLDRVLGGIAAWPARACRIVGDLGRPPREPEPAGRRGPTGSRPTIRAAPPAVDTLAFLCRMFTGYCRGLYRDLFRHPDWAVGVTDRDLEALLEEGEVRDVEWISCPSSSLYLADPFCVEKDGVPTLLCEQFDHRRSRGWITALDPSDGASGGVGDHDEPVDPDAAARGAPSDGTARGGRRGDGGPDGRRPPVIELPCHGSYPYLFRHEGDVYCVPETHQVREVRLYRARRFPDEWEQVDTLIEDFAAVDPTVFRHDGRWWLFCTDGARGSQRVLHAWFAEELRAPWRPHALNPVKIDPRSSRPGGTPFRHRGELYRPAQDCSSTYGGGLTLNRIEELNPTRFREETVQRLHPGSDGPHRRGIHTLCVTDGHLVVDGKSDSFVPDVFLRWFTAGAPHKVLPRKNQ